MKIAAEKLKTAETVNCNSSRLSDEMKLDSSDNPLQNELKWINQIKQSKTLMKNLLANFYQFNCVIAKILYSKERLFTRVWLCPVLRFS